MTETTKKTETKKPKYEYVIVDGFWVLRESYRRALNAGVRVIEYGGRGEG